MAKKKLKLHKQDGYEPIVVVQELDKEGNLIDSLLTLVMGDSERLWWKDQETGKYVETDVCLVSKDKVFCIDSEGFEWESPVEELLTEVLY
jgi:hypothetical protein